MSHQGQLTAKNDLPVASASTSVAKNDKPTPSGSKDQELSKRQPKPATCVAFGDFCDRSAEDPKRLPADRQRLLDEARVAYQQALQNDPNNLAALHSLARLYNEMDDYPRAVATYQKALKVHPQQTVLWYELGMTYARHKEWEPALQHLQHAVELDPEQRVYAHSYGFCLARAGRYAESLAAFTRVEEEGVAHYDLARMLHHMKEEELSKAHLRLALAKKPDLAPAREMLASLEGAPGQVQPAGTQSSENDAREPQSPVKYEVTPMVSAGKPSV
jgi:tetratricopeptide (TPR) repeat protein